MIIQRFGELKLNQRNVDAMLCMDIDKPLEYSIHIWDSEFQFAGLLMQKVEVIGHEIKLKGKRLLKASESGALYFPILDEEERAFLDSLDVYIEITESGVAGRWTYADQSKGSFSFLNPKSDRKINPKVCKDWTDFKKWAFDSRKLFDTALYRGHGDHNYRLQTSLHRVGRARIDRYCTEILGNFHGQVEAVLGARVDMNNGSDYSMVLGLAQHHGLPTPLLDWTESPYIAAFFAFSDALEKNYSTGNESFVRIYALTKRFISERSPPSVVLPYKSPYVNSLQISPRHNPRIQAQQGHFLVTNICDLEQWFLNFEETGGNSVLLAADVPARFAAEALEDLAFMGITAATLFPGLDGICRALRHRMIFPGDSIDSGGLPTNG